MMVIDEVHNLRSLKFYQENQGKRSKVVSRCSKLAEKRILLTATPFVNDLSDFIPIVNYLYGRDLLTKNLKQMK